MWQPTYQYNLAAYVFVPSDFGGNIPTVEFGMISAETACWDTERKYSQNFDFDWPLYLILWQNVIQQLQLPTSSKDFKRIQSHNADDVKEYRNRDALSLF